MGTYNTAYNRYPYTYNPYSLVARAPTSAVYASSAPASGVYATSTPTSAFYATKAQPMPLRDYISYFNAQAQRRSNMVQTPATQKRVTREAEAEPEADAQYYNNYFGTYTTPNAGFGYPNLHTAYTGYPNAHTAYTGYPNAVNAYYTGSPYTKTAFKGYSYFSAPTLPTTTNTTKCTVVKSTEVQPQHKKKNYAYALHTPQKPIFPKELQITQ